MEISKIYSFTPIIAAIVFTVALLAPPAHAVIVTVGGTQYDVTNSAPITINDFLGSPSFSAGPAQDQPWWGNQAAAVQAATDVGGSLGNPNSTAGGPIFAWVTNGFRLDYAQYNSGTPAVEDTWIRIADNPGTRVFAIATPVATPDTGSTALLLGVGLLGLAAIRRRMGRS